MPIKKTTDLNNIQKSIKKVEESQPPVAKNDKTVKKTKHGGSRPGAGRKLGSVNKIQGKDFLAKYKKLTGKDFEDALILDIIKAQNENNDELVFKYRNALFKYLFSDVATQDITSAGKPLGIEFSFKQVETNDWQNLPKTVKVSK